MSFAIALALAVGLLVTLLPAAWTLRLRTILYYVRKGGLARSAPGVGRSRRASSTQIAMALILLVAGGLS